MGSKWHEPKNKPQEPKLKQRHNICNARPDIPKTNQQHEIFYVLEMKRPEITHQELAKDTTDTDKKNR